MSPAKPGACSTSSAGTTCCDCSCAPGVTTRYRNSVLGWTWSYVRPAAQFLVFWVVLGLFLNLERGIPNYAVYLFSGIVVINLFSEAFKNATTSIVGNAPLVRKVYLPRQLFAVSAVIVAFVHFLPQVGLLLVVCLFLGWITSISILSVLAILAGATLVMLFALGLGLLFGAMNVRYRDAENIVELLLLLATWASPVLYSWIMVQDAITAAGVAVLAARAVPAQPDHAGSRAVPLRLLVPRHADHDPDSACAGPQHAVDVPASPSPSC